MMQQDTTRPGGDYDYDAKGEGYAQRRRADPRIAAQVLDCLGDACSVLNVGAGTGNYEPTDRIVVALEPARAMRAQRPREAGPCVIGVAEALPFDDNSFDAVMSLLSLHQWVDKPKGLQELARVARNRVVLLTFDPTAFDTYWLTHYMPEIAAAEAARFLPIEAIRAHLGGAVEVRPCMVPSMCSDGFNEAYFGRPELLLNADVRAAQSGWAFAPEGAEARFVERLSRDLESGAWDKKYGHLRDAQAYCGAMRFVVAHV